MSTTPKPEKKAPAEKKAPTEKKKAAPKEKKAAAEGARKSGRDKKDVERYHVDVPEVKKRKRTASASPAKKAKKTKKAKKSKKEGPKRAATAFVYFSKANRASVVKENPDATFGEVGKLLGEAWQNTKAADRKKFEAEAAKDKVRYNKEKAAAEKAAKKE